MYWCNQYVVHRIGSAFVGVYIAIFHVFSLIARIGRGKHQKAWKKEIRQEHNSNPLQRHEERHEYVQLALIRYISITIDQPKSSFNLQLY